MTNKRFAITTAALATACGISSYATATLALTDTTFLATWFATASVVLGLGFIINAGAFAISVTGAALKADDQESIEAARLAAMSVRIVATTVEPEKP